MQLHKVKMPISLDLPGAQLQIKEPWEFIAQLDERATPPDGEGERFFGYAVIGLPFATGHVLGLRRFPASSIGSGYTSVWRRDQAGKWTFFQDVAPELACSRYFGKDIEHDVYGEILDCAYQWAAHHGEIDGALWERLCRLIEAAARAWRKPDHGIWELREPGRVFTYSAALCQVALDRRARMVERFKLPGDWRSWRASAEEIPSDDGTRKFFEG